MRAQEYGTGKTCDHRCKRGGKVVTSAQALNFIFGHFWALASLTIALWTTDPATTYGCDAGSIAISFYSFRAGDILYLRKFCSFWSHGKKRFCGAKRQPLETACATWIPGKIAQQKIQNNHRKSIGVNVVAVSIWPKKGPGQAKGFLVPFGAILIIETRAAPAIGHGNAHGGAPPVNLDCACLEIKGKSWKLLGFLNIGLSYFILLCQDYNSVVGKIVRQWRFIRSDGDNVVPLHSAQNFSHLRFYSFIWSNYAGGETAGLLYQHFKHVCMGNVAVVDSDDALKFRHGHLIQFSKKKSI